MSVGDESSSEGEEIRKSVCGLDWITRDDPPGVGPNWPSVSMVDLFCGCGGMSLGAREALRCCERRMKVNLAVDVMTEAVDVYRRTFDCGDAAECIDVREVFENESRIEALSDTDLLLAGPPCQGHSDLNNHTRRSDDRNSLYEETAIFATSIDPSVVIIENVPGARHDIGQAVQNAERHLRSQGYHTHILVLEAVDFGIPQTRKRLFLVALKSPVAEEQLKQYDGGPAEAIREFIEDLDDEHDRSSDSKFRKASRMSMANQWRAAWLLVQDETCLSDDLRPPCHRDKDHSYKSVYGRLSYDEPAQTITTGFGSMGQGRYLHPDPPPDDLRVITPHEAARIQGLPDFLGPIFDKVTTRRALHGMIGNAVPPKLVGVLVENLVAVGALDVEPSRPGPRDCVKELLAAE